MHYTDYISRTLFLSQKLRIMAFSEKQVCQPEIEIYFSDNNKVLDSENKAWKEKLSTMKHVYFVTNSVRLLQIAEGIQGNADTKKICIKVLHKVAFAVRTK